MSDSSSEKKAPTARAVNRWGVGSLSVIQVVLLFTIIVVVNYLGSTHFYKKDFSREGAYSLSPSTKRYLASDELKSHTRPIKWIMAIPRTSGFYDRVRSLSEDYARLSGGKIEIEILDPMRSPDRTQQVAAAYGVSLVSDLIIIDARTDESAVTTQDSTGTHILNPNVKLVVSDEMNIYSTDKGQRRLTGFQGEDVLTARLVEAIEGKPRKMLFLSDKSRIDAEGDNSPWKSLENTLRFQNIQLSGAELSGLSEIPADTEGIALVAPKYDFSDEEIAVLEKYWSRPRAAILVLLQAGETPPKLRAFLRSNGVTPRRDRIVTRDHNRTITTARGLYTYNVDFIKDLAGQAAVFEGASSSLEVREGAEDLVNRKISPVGLIQVADEFWGETKFGEGTETFDPNEDSKPPLFLAASVTRGAANDDRFAADTSRMIVVSNTDFLDPTRRRAENIDFLASSVNWLVGRQSLAGIGPRSLWTYKLPILDAQVSFINRVNLFFLPALFLLIGGFVWSSRRA